MVIPKVDNLGRAMYQSSVETRKVVDADVTADHLKRLYRRVIKPYFTLDCNGRNSWLIASLAG